MYNAQPEEQQRTQCAKRDGDAGRQPLPQRLLHFVAKRVVPLGRLLDAARVGCSQGRKAAQACGTRIERCIICKLVAIRLHDYSSALNKCRHNAKPVWRQRTSKSIISARCQCNRMRASTAFEYLQPAASPPEAFRFPAAACRPGACSPTASAAGSAPAATQRPWPPDRTER